MMLFMRSPLSGLMSQPLLHATLSTAAPRSYWVAPGQLPGDCAGRLCVAPHLQGNDKLVGAANKLVLLAAKRREEAAQRKVEEERERAAAEQQRGRSQRKS